MRLIVAGLTIIGLASIMLHAMINIVIYGEVLLRETSYPIIIIEVGLMVTCIALGLRAVVVGMKSK